ncbi:MAG: hypothetical protein KKC84_02070 [Candidatus Omnitrophica bacterium]|nr:hypothetical protein [Candidatus Omnitrophota bacterium]
MFGWFKNSIVGLDIDEGRVMAAELVRKSDRVQVNSLMMAKTLQELSSQEPFRQALRKGTGAIINLPTQNALFRNFPLTPSLAKSRQRVSEKDVILFLSRQNLPFKLDECFWNTFVLDGHLHLIAVKKEVVDGYIAAAEQSGVHVVGITTSMVALYNLFIYNYSLENKFSLLHICSTASDLILYDAKRMWVYPLPLGKDIFARGPEALVRFSQEVARIFNTHYLQNPLTSQKTSRLYVSGEDSSPELLAALKKTLADAEVLLLDPFQKVSLTHCPASNASRMALSVGLGITYFCLPGHLAINHILDRLKQKRHLVQQVLARKILSLVMVGLLGSLGYMGVRLFQTGQRESKRNKELQRKVSYMLPEIEQLNGKKNILAKPASFLQQRVDQQQLYLKVFAMISQAKSPAIKISECNLDSKEDARVSVFLAGTGPDYEEINAFLTKLKKNKDVKEAKLISSSFLTKGASEGIEFKLRSEVGI